MNPEKNMTGRKKQISRKVTKLLLSMVFLAMLLMGSVSIWSLHTIKDISADTSKELGKTAAEDAEEALENMAGEQLQAIAVEKADYIEEKFETVGSYPETVNEAVLNTTMGEKGYAFLVNEKGQVMVSLMKEGETAVYAEKNVDLRMSKNKKLAQIAEEMVAGKTGLGKLFIDGREVYLAYAPLKNLGWSFVTIMDVEKVIAPARESQNRILRLTKNAAQVQNEAIGRMHMLFLAMLAAVVALIGIISTLFTRKITEPIRRLTKEVAKIDGGNLDYRIHIETGDEIEDLGNAFNHMTDQIHQYIQSLNLVMSEKERIRTEIQVASRLQADMLPTAKNAYEDRDEFSLYAIMTPAKGVGGDFYDFFLLDDDHLALIMADVSGKGVPAALFMVVSRTLLRSHIVKDVPLNEAVEKVNDNLCKNNKNGMFVTAWIGVLTISTGKLIFVNAGHCRPLIRQADGACTYETAISGFVLAGMEETKYRQSEIRLRKGDTLLLYTDGVTEATNSQNNLYGEKRLEQLMTAMEQQEPKDVLLEVWRDVNHFQGEAEQSDDITMLALRYNGNGYAVMTDTAKIDNIQKFNSFIDDILAKARFSQKTSTKILIAMDEIFSNICYYSGANEITVGCKIKNREASIYFEDDGIPYNPLEKQDPDVAELLEKRKIGGLGIYLVKNRMDKIWYEYVEGRNRLGIMKRDEE
ncbi:MAG: SpoIIE family protein phosphatase [Roseburia sp.]|nr:SpoIIE family protein phosphatase [Roseburia sp.]MCM1280060.1 SpoIIE family protein phosphatase [Robinsoniella sp.]